MEELTSTRSTTRVVIGALILVAGLAILLDNLYLIEIGPVWDYWPLIIVALGLNRIVQAENSWERRRGFLWTFIGLWLFISVGHIFDLTFRESWPILLIGIGISMIWKTLSPEPRWKSAKD
jgi:hypothetical protein